MKRMLDLHTLAGGLLAMATLWATPSEARITRIEITKVEPAFDGQTFGNVGAYERLIGRAYGEVDPGLAGNAIIQDIAARTQGELKLSAGTLYRSIQRILDQGLVIETRDRPAPELDDERRRYYRITSLGAAVARAEARRLTQLIKLARACGFAPGRA